MCRAPLSDSDWYGQWCDRLAEKSVRRSSRTLSGDDGAQLERRASAGLFVSSDARSLKSVAGVSINSGERGGREAFGAVSRPSEFDMKRAKRPFTRGENSATFARMQS